ncbi:ATP-binding cassette domain-containing protein [Spiroplasma endosymbiont of Dioctria linearis]|uniref:ATP-binding cassette domain-containing protein n=1 Tax=Spiroplasma endosymbiont of Dioctria linearis TaxID=3066290 RepID=UPI00313E29B0
MKINMNKKISDFFQININDLEIKENEIIGVMGANGSGKTTFLRLLSNSFKNSKNVKVDQNYSYCILQQVSDFGLVKLVDLVILFNKLNKKNIDINKFFDNYDLLPFKESYFAKLSPGQQQRFKFMLIQLFETDILILDETFNFLDSAWKNKLLNDIKEIKNNYKNIFIIDHDLEKIKQICNRIICFKNGEIVIDSKDVNSINQIDIDNILVK